MPTVFVLDAGPLVAIAKEAGVFVAALPSGKPLSVQQRMRLRQPLPMPRAATPDRDFIEELRRFGAVASHWFGSCSCQ